MASDDERMHEALRKRAQEAVDAAAETVSASEVLAHVSAELRESGMTSRCAWCGRYRVGDRWLSLRDSLVIDASRTTHSICDDCIDALREAGLSV